ncbi:MAG: hypothetical protein CMC26_02625 [Flavobacteriaceae bacterium]|nr:hypothetical protein [Flavobacteriaceae bacterium]
MEPKSVKSTITKNADSKEITFIIDLAVNPDSNEDLNLFAKEITENVINTEDFCLEYGYFVSEDGSQVTLYEKYIDSKSAITHAQNFMSSPYFERFFNLFSINKFIVTGPASDDFKKFTSENGFVIDFRSSAYGFFR